MPASLAARLPTSTLISASSRLARGVGCRAATTFAPRDVLPVPIRVVTIGKGTSRPAEDMAAEWEAKVKRYTKYEAVQMKGNPKKAASREAAMASESDKVLALAGPRDYVVVLDERGTRATSHDIAHLLAKAGDASSKSILFCIGGPYGHTDAMRERANQVIRLSDCVLNHQVARVVLLEQLYRGWTIIRNEPYHH